MKLLPLNRNQINTNEFLNRLWIRYFLLLRISFLSFRSYVDAISENKEHDRKHRKLDHLIDLAGDGSGVAGDDEGIADIQSCIDKVRPVRFGEHLNLYELEVDGAYGLDYCNWMIDCGGEKISIVSSSSMVQNIHPLPFDETDGARFETILIEIGNCVANTLKNKGNDLFPLR
ncbi:beta-lactamase-like protein [Rhizophagus irregularis DAOM 181602=DAOM 197198]|nr:beta-lactamase-like protein [Rhizophagus irregularis DAOM 181602=DAOM 197198]